MFAVLAPIISFLPGLLLKLLLGWVGFTAVGPAAGSFAAWWQSLLGPIASGSWFATFQSAGMGGHGLATLAWVVRTVAVLLAGMLGIFRAAIADLFKTFGGSGAYQAGGKWLNDTLAT
ncbi:hypothetical protein BDV96DRAFT_32165 [Lophiotrema nucula]|uniref:Uncharacterized protein n=1 Tax=Lophiotrema nucula TaxID=690887 RepID=A0A6A5ZC92_9PLEO|nr:hypothetical protein BDV96DRAFT_32165 [Lophiotrema nucula]